jgi:hypothetical protein
VDAALKVDILSYNTGFNVSYLGFDKCTFYRMALLDG